METKLLVLKPAKIFGDPNELANFRFANGRGFPASYQRFATQYGWGRSLGNYLVHIPSAILRFLAAGQVSREIYLYQ